MKVVAAKLVGLALVVMIAGCVYNVPRPVVSFSSEPVAMSGLSSFALSPEIELQTGLVDGESSVFLAYTNNRDHEVRIETIRVLPDDAKGRCALLMTNKVSVQAETRIKIPLMTVAELEDCAGESVSMIGQRGLSEINGKRSAPSIEAEAMEVVVEFRSREVPIEGGWAWDTREDFYFWYL